VLNRKAEDDCRVACTYIGGAIRLMVRRNSSPIRPPANLLTVAEYFRPATSNVKFSDWRRAGKRSRALGMRPHRSGHDSGKELRHPSATTRHS
jgi:hypothetical protein